MAVQRTHPCYQNAIGHSRRFVLSYFWGVLACTAIFSLLLWGNAFAQPKRPLPLKGPYAQVDVRTSEAAMDILAESMDDVEREAEIAKIMAAPGQYTPPVLYYMARELFRLGRKDEAVFWYYAAQLRAHFDANRCAEESPKQAVDVLNRLIGTPIEAYAKLDSRRLADLLPRIIEWDRTTPSLYDARWINLHGRDAVQSAATQRKTVVGKSSKPSMSKPMRLSLPETEWGAIAERTRTEYISAFSAAIARQNPSLEKTQPSVQKWSHKFEQRDK